METGSQKINTILVVDDVPVNVQLLSSYLSAEGYRVVSAENGLEALDQIKENDPDMVLLDVMLPKMNGFEVCEIVKADKETKFIPVIMITALNELEDKIRGLNSGADDFVCKPFNKLELLVRVRSLLRIKLLNDALSEKVMELKQAKETLINWMNEVSCPICGTQYPDEIKPFV